MENQTPHIECAQVSENLYEYLTYRLTPAQRSIIAGHLMSCSKCRAELDEMKITLGLLDQIKPPKLSEGFTEKVMQSIEPKVIPFIRQPVYRLIMQGAAAAIVVLAIVSIIKLKPTSTPDTSTIRGGTTTSIIDESCRNAIELYNKGTSNPDLKQKEALLQQALATRCTDNKVLARIHNNLADYSEQQGFFDEALSRYQQAIKLDPALTTAIIGMGDVYKKQGQTQTAIEQYKRALVLFELAKAKGENVQEQIEGLKKEISKINK